MIKLVDNLKARATDTDLHAGLHFLINVNKPFLNSSNAEDGSWIVPFKIMRFASS